MAVTIGVLALQGDFERHQARLCELGVGAMPIRSVNELQHISGIAIPGGESSAMLRLMDIKLRSELLERISKGLPVIATCAGLILLAKRVVNPAQESLGLLDVDVRRNAYGRQLESFVSNEMELTHLCKELFIKELLNNTSSNMEAVFIRAPQITRVGKNVEVLATLNNQPIMVRQQNIIAATFHPELSNNSLDAHKLFLSLVHNTEN